MKAALLILSVGLNVALGGMVARWLAQPALTGPPTTPAAASSIRDEHEIPAAITRPQPSVLATNRFHWRQIESADYRQYVANLRAVSCPEKTVRDIVIADVEKHYAAESANLRMEAGFWVCGAERRAAERQREQRQRALGKSKSDLLRDLLGIEAPPASHHSGDDLIEQAIMRFVLGPLPEGVPEQIMAALAWDESEAGKVRDEAGAILLPEDEARIRQVHAQSIARIQRLLAPAQFEEFTARIAAVQMVDGDVQYARLQPAELRQVARIHMAVFGFAEGSSSDLFDNRSESEAKDAEFELRLKEFLGEARYAAYQRNKDPEFRNLLALTAGQHLTESVAAGIYDIKQLAASEQERLGQDGSISPSERLAQLRQVQAASSDSVQGLLGEKAFQAYLAGGGAWLTNAPKP